jgi:hypothetical protein
MITVRDAARPLLGKRVAFFYGPGSLNVDYAAGLVRGIERALLELGASVETLSSAFFKEELQGFYAARPKVGVERFADDSPFVTQLCAWLEEGPAFDLTVGYFYDTYLTDRVQQTLRRRGGRLINYPLNLLDQELHFERCLGFFDETWCAEEGALEVLRARHPGRIRYVPLASDPHVFRALSPPRQPGLLFVGSAYGERLELLARCGDVLPLQVAGGGFGLGGALRTLARRLVRDRQPLGPLASARVVLDSLQERKPVGDEAFVRLAARNGVSVGFSDVRKERTGTIVHKVRLREYDCTMAGLCHIARRLPELERHFAPGREILLYESTDELLSQLRGIAAGATNFRAIGQAARRRAAADHTWTRRLQPCFGEGP